MLAIGTKEGSFRTKRAVRTYTADNPALKRVKLQKVEELSDDCVDHPITRDQDRSFKHNHDYIYKCDCVEDCLCSSCLQKEEVIKKKQSEIDQLQFHNTVLQNKLLGNGKLNVVNTFSKSDAKVKTYTGLPSKSAFLDLVNYLIEKASKIRYWRGSKKVISTKVPRKFGKSPKKSGPNRKLKTS